jgi:hypothetical protein
MMSNEGDTYRLVVRELAELFGWSDRTPLHALIHVRNAVLNLRADLAAERVLRKKAEDRLAGYQSAPAHVAATVLKGRLDKAEAEIVRLKALFPACEFCGTEMPAEEKCPC